MKTHIIILLYIVLRTVSGQLNDHRYPTLRDAYNQSKIQMRQDDHPDPIPGDVYNHSKVHMKQNGRHQPEYYGYEQNCPDAEDIAPCVCTYDTVSSAMNLTCSAVESEEQLKQIFKANFPFKNFNQFNLIDNNNIKVLEEGVFNGISFEIIHIEGNSLEVIELHALDSCYETATKIYLDYNEITSFPCDEVSLFSKLSLFDISSNSLSVIPADAFHGLTALDTLYIDSNDADIVGTFQDLPNLWYIDLHYNAMTAIPVHFIKTGSSDLSYIDLYGNNIVSVEPDAFDIVDGLNIAMGGNSLSILDEATWRPHLEAGGALFARDNPLVCGCDIAWLFGEDQLLGRLGYSTRCTDGEFVHDLDPSIFDNC